MLFFMLTFLVTWAFWFAGAALPGGFAAGGQLRTGLPTLLFYLGVFSPALVGIALTSWEMGADGVRALLSRLFKADVGAQWYVFAITSMAVAKLVAAVASRFFTGTWPRFGGSAVLLMVAATIFSTVVGGQAGEEVGWRGYALPRMAQRLGLSSASILLGMLWAAWHLPLFYIAGTDTAGQSFPLYLAKVTALSVAIAWVYWKTNGSLLLTMLMHAAINNMSDIVPSIPRTPANPMLPWNPAFGWITAIVLWIPAVFFLVAMRSATLADDAIDVGQGK